MSEISYIAGLDIGTTTIRCHIIDSRAKPVGEASTSMTLLYPHLGYVEIDPNKLWNTIVSITKEAISNANLKPENIKCLAITTQRGSFITWRKDNQQYLHNFITWKDLRSKELVEKWNRSALLKTLQAGAYLLYGITKKDRYLVGSRLRFSTLQCTSRLLWVLENDAAVKKELNKNNLCFGTMDTWLVHKLTGGAKYVTEVTHASATGFFDPFVMKWADWPKLLMGIPTHIYPEVVDSDYDFGSTVPEIFGVSIPIKSLIADQQASMVGMCCFKKNDIKITMGTGSFIDINTEFVPVASAVGTYPLVAWSLNKTPVYLTEASCKDAGTLIKWALQVGIATSVSEISTQAERIKSSDGVFFIPAFSGLGPPISDDLAAAGFIGIKPTTTKNHLMRAILESIVYSIIAAYNTIQEYKSTAFKEINVDGGISNNNFVCQLLADMLDLNVVRTTCHEKTLMGATFLAGLNAGIWANTDELRHLRNVERIFTPSDMGKDEHFKNMQKWLEAVKRFQKWYK